MSSAEGVVEVGTSPVVQPSPAQSLSIWGHSRLQRVVAVIAAALLALAVTWWFRFRPFVSTDDARVAAPMLVIAAEGSGGRVDRVLVREGQVVQAAEPLVELDATSERAQVDKARALLLLAEARVGEAEAQLQIERQISDATDRRAQANVRSAQAAQHRTVQGPRSEEIAKAQADVTAAETLAAQARSDLDRANALSRDGAIAPAILESAQTADASARAVLGARKAGLDLLKHGSRPEDISIAQGAVQQAQAGLVEASAGGDRIVIRARQLEETRAQVAQARAELALAEVALSRMTLKSNVGGTVVRVTVDPSDHLAPGQGAVTIVDLAHVWIAANIEETSSGRLRQGQAASISIDEGGELVGTVDVITQSAASQFALIPADNAAGNFTKVVQRIPIRIAIDPSSRVQSLRVGQSVVVRIRVL